MPRSFRCRECGQLLQVETTCGPLPSICDPCDPDRARQREANRGRTSTLARRTRELRDAHARIAQLEALLDLPATSTLGPPCRQTLARAIRRVATAEGHHQTAERLAQLAVVAQEWARVLVISPRAQERIGERTAAERELEAVT